MARFLLSKTAMNWFQKTVCLILLLLPATVVHSAILDRPHIPDRPLPPLASLEKIALKRAGLDPNDIRSWQRRSRYSAALPRIQVGWESAFVNQNTTIIQDSISVTSSGVAIGPESNRIDQDLKNNQDLEVKAVWALDELLFNRDQLDISREARDLLFVRNKLVEELQQSYYDLKALLIQLQLQPEPNLDPLTYIKFERLVDKLDSLTGGEFTQMWKLTNKKIG